MRRSWLFLGIWLVTAGVPAHAAPLDGLRSQIERVRQAESSRMQIGVSVVHIESGQRVDVAADRPYPLASVFKLPIMMELCRQMQAHENNLSLDTEMTITEAGKCIGSGQLKNAAAGTQVSIERCIELMETISDNTATDMLFNRIGLGSVNRFLHGLGLNRCNVYLTNRAAWLVSLGLAPELKGMGPAALVQYWTHLSQAEREALASRIVASNTGLSMQQFQRDEDASESRPYAQDMRVAEATDNQAPPAELASLLVRFYQGSLLDAHWTHFCLDVLSRQKFNSRMPRLLPAGVRVYHKTGTLEGIVNDAGVIEIAPDNHIVVVVLIRRVASGQSSEAGTAIARIARAAYDAFK